MYRPYRDMLEVKITRLFEDGMNKKALMSLLEAFIDDKYFDQKTDDEHKSENKYKRYAKELFKDIEKAGGLRRWKQSIQANKIT